MAKNVVIRDVTYNSVPSVTIPLASGSGNATFTDTSDATINTSLAGMIGEGYTAYGSNGLVEGTATLRSGSDMTVSGATVSVPAGLYLDPYTKSVPNGSATAPSSISGTSATVSTGTNSITLSKSVSVTPIVTSGYVATGTAGNSSVSLTASVTGTAQIPVISQDSTTKVLSIS